MRGTFIPYGGNPYIYGQGPGHLFFDRDVVPGGLPPSSNSSSSPLSNTNSSFWGQTAEWGDGSRGGDFVNPNVTYDPVWGNVMLGVAGLMGGPLASTLAGAGIGANMAQAIQNEYSSRGFAPPQGVPSTPLEGALAGAARGALGVLGGILGLSPGWNAMLEAAAAIPALQAANTYAGAIEAISSSKNNALGGYTVAGLPPEELGGKFGNSSFGGKPEGIGATVDISGLETSPDKGDPKGGFDGGSKDGGWGGDEGFNEGGLVELPGGGKVAIGAGGGLDDLIPTTIDGRQAARLSDGEFVIPADVVAFLGDGSSREGSRKLYDLVRAVRRAKTGTHVQAPPIQFKGILEKVLR